MHIFFMDTEGIGDVSKNPEYDNKIFTLAVLLSSYFIFNSMGVINESDINNLSLVTKLAQNI